MFTDSYKLNRKAYEALKNIKNKKEVSKLNQDVIFENETRVANLKKSQKVFKEYDNDIFEIKVKKDMFIYNKLLSKINESDQEFVKNLITEMLTDVQNVYKFINIEPKIIGGVNINDKSNSELYTEAEQHIKEFMNREYYDLSKQKRDDKYKDRTINLSKQLISESENVTIEEALEFSNKVLLVEKLVKDLNFPYVIDCRIKEIFEDNLYNDFFDIDLLTTYIEGFDANLRKFSKIIAAII